MEIKKVTPKNVILTLALVLAITVILYPKPAATQQEPVIYTIQSGDTLWDICREQYGDKVDIRRLVYQIRMDNDIEDPGQLRPGMEIGLPGSW